MPVYKAEGIVLRRQTIGEADRAVTLLTREYGKLRAAARGVRKTTSRLGGRLEPFTHGRFLLARGKTLDVVAQVEVVETFVGLRTDLLRSGYASYVAELADRFLPERDRHESAFALVRSALTLLNQAGEGEAELVTLWFALRLAADLGYRPEVDACVVCGRRLPRDAIRAGRGWAFSLSLGGALCSGCGDRDQDAMRTSPGVLATCAYLLRLSAEQPIRLRIPDAQRRDIERLVQAHLEYHLEAKLRSPAVIERLRGIRPQS